MNRVIFKMPSKIGISAKRSPNRAYLASVLRTSAQIPRSARNFRCAQPLCETTSHEEII